MDISSSTFKFSLASCLLPRFEKKLAHLNRLLSKMGKPAITFTTENYRVITLDFRCHVKGESSADDIVSQGNVEFCDVVCEGLVSVKKDDKNYRFIGSVKYDELRVKQVFCNDESLLHYFTDDFREGACDHCNSVRKNRNSYFLFECDGQVLQIGSTCAKEYFGIDSVAFLDCQFNTFSCASYDEELAAWLAEGRTPACYYFGEIVSAFDVATNGFLTWRKEDEFDIPRTVCQARGILNTNLCDRPHGRCEFHLTREEIYEYWKSRYEATGNQFAYNCMQAMTRDGSTATNLGAYGYAIFGAFNAKVKERIAAEVRAGTAPCPYEKDSRVSIKGKVISCRCFSTVEYYTWRGVDVTKYTVNFKADNGTLYHFTTSSSTFDAVREGDELTVRGTIGETRPYQGVDYTVLMRPKVTEEKPAKAKKAAKSAAA